MGTAIFPPDSLSDLIMEELQDDETDDDDGLMLQSLQYKVLGTLQVTHKDKTTISTTTTTNTDTDNNKTFQETQEEATSSSDDASVSSLEEDTMSDDIDDDIGNDDCRSEREEKIQQNAQKMLTVIQNLPGLMDITREHFYQAMNKVADQDGNITTRQTFSEMLDMLRQRHL